MESQQSEWLPNQPQETTSVQEFDGLIRKLSEARKAHEVAKKLAAEVYHSLEEVENLVINALKSNGRTKFECEGVALVQIRTKETYETPKTAEQKKLLFQYIQGKYGVETCTNMLSINHQTLNSWANKEIEADPGLSIPGLNAPTSVETLYFMRKD